MSGLQLNDQRCKVKYNFGWEEVCIEFDKDRIHGKQYVENNKNETRNIGASGCV